MRYERFGTWITVVAATLFATTACAAQPGDLDAMFGTGGRIVVGGETDTQNGIGANFGLARYETDGSLDTSFGTGGKVVTDIAGIDAVFALAIQTDGKIIAMGSAQGVGNPGNGLAVV